MASREFIIAELLETLLNGSEEATQSTPASDALYDYFTDIISSMPGNVYWFDKNCCGIGCNYNALKTLKLSSPEQFFGLSFNEMRQSADWSEEATESFYHDTAEVMRSGKPRLNVEEPPIEGQDGKKVYFLTSRVPLRNQRNEIIGVVGISFDITSRKESEMALLEEKRRAEQAIQVKDQFLKNMEHDLRTPFNGIYGLSSLMHEQETDFEKKEQLKMIVDSTQALLELCTDIMNCARSDNTHLPIVEKRLDLNECLQTMVRMQQPAARQKRLMLTFHVQEGCPTVVRGDKQRMQRIMTNLLGNAIKFTNMGSVAVTMERCNLDSVAREVVIAFRVSDTGIGIPEEKQQFIFEKFSRVDAASSGNYQGLGIGLRVVKEFVADLGGEIELDSEPGKGTNFRILLPFKLPLDSPHLTTTTSVNDFNSD
jgi:two-component system aerobic respiration control sensor histidine kinase ArcB